jgi:hypothetical protein
MHHTTITVATRGKGLYPFTWSFYIFSSSGGVNKLFVSDCEPERSE